MEMANKTRKNANKAEMLEKKKNAVSKLRICTHLSVESTRHCHNISATSNFDNKHDSNSKVDLCCKRNVDRNKSQKQVNCQINTEYDNNVKVNKNTQLNSGEEVNNEHVCCTQSKRFSVENEKISLITEQERDIKQTYVTDWVSHLERDRANNFCDDICNSIHMNINVDSKINETLSSSQSEDKEKELQTLSSAPMRMSRNSMTNHNKTTLHHPNEDDISKTIMEIDMQEKNSRDGIDSNTDDNDNSVIANSILMKSITSNFIYYEQPEEQNETKLVELTHICNRCTNDLSFQQSMNELDNFLQKHKDDSSINNYSNALDEVPEYAEVQKTLSSSSNVHSHLTHPRPASMLNDYHDNNLISICAQRVSTDVPAQRNSYFEMESEGAILYPHNGTNKTRSVHEPLPLLANCESPLPFRQRAKTECVNGMLPESVNKSYIRTSSCRMPPLHILSELDEIHDDDDDDDDNDDDNAEKRTHDSSIKVNVNKESENNNSATNSSRQINPETITIAENNEVTENSKNDKSNINCLNKTDNKEQEIFNENKTLTSKREESTEKCFDANADTNENHWIQEQDNVKNRNKCSQKQETTNFANFTQKGEVTSPIIISLKSSSETRSFNTLSNQFLQSEQTSPLLSSTITNLDLLSLDAPIDMCISSGESDAKDLSSGISISTAYFNVLAISTERINKEAANMHKMISMELSSPNPSHHCAKTVFSPFMMPPQHYVSPTHFSASRSWNCDLVLHKAAQCNFSSSLSSTNPDEQKQQQQQQYLEQKEPYENETTNLTWSSESPVHHPALCNRLCEMSRVVLWDQSPTSSTLYGNKEHDIPLAAESWNNETTLPPPNELNV